MKNIVVMNLTQEIEIQIWRLDVIDNSHIFHFNGEIMENKQGLNDWNTYHFAHSMRKNNSTKH